MPNPKRILSQQELEIIQDNTADEGARILNVNRTTIARWCKREGINFKRINKKASSEELVEHRKIRKAHKDGMSVKDLALQFNVSHRKIRDVLRLKYYGKVFDFLSPEVTGWLDQECPKEMNRYEFIAVLVTDAYLETKE